MAMGTHPCWGGLYHEEGFLGAESLAGNALLPRQGEIVPDLLDAATLFPVHSMEHERSAAAYPVRRKHCVTGALIVSCT